MRYLANVAEAKEFHNEIQNRYHFNTHVFYGKDSSDAQRTWESVRWECLAAADTKRPRDPSLGNLSAPGTNGEVNSPYSWVSVNFSAQQIQDQAVMHADNGLGKAECKIGDTRYYFKASDKDTSGDGTVPEISGHAAYGAAKQIYAMSGFGHEPAFRDLAAQQAVLHAILSIASEVQVR